MPNRQWTSSRLRERRWSKRVPDSGAALFLAAVAVGPAGSVTGIDLAPFHTRLRIVPAS